MLTNIDAVIFDLDGTLIDSMWVWRDIDVEYLKMKKLNCPEDLVRQIEGMSFTETAQHFKSRFHLEESIDEIKETWLGMAHNHYRENVKLKAGVIEFLTYLKSNNIKIGMATSNDYPLIDIILEKYEIGSFFDAVVTSCDVQKGKPHPDVFLKAAELLKVDPTKCLVFEDTVAGITGGKNAGMKVVGIFEPLSISTIQELEEHVEHFIESYHDVLNQQ